MNKNDNRCYNRKQNRDLSIEMDLWIALKGKLIEAKGCLCDNKPIYGIITNVIYEPGKINYCHVELDNGTDFTFKVKFGRIVKDDKITII